MPRVLYLTISGPGDATRASIPFHLVANGSAEVGHDVDVVLGGDAAEFVKQAAIDGVRGVGVPPLRELVDKATSKGVRFHV
jgi:predicted peroxiredoxin